VADAYDVIIIGTGAGGGTLALELAPFGRKILLLERGGWLPREKQNWSAEEVFVDNRYVSRETWLDSDGKPFQPGAHYFVGGATKMYGAALFRLRERDFGELRHQDGISPAWPISYAEMEPYYTRAENLYQVHGARGEDPTEPPTSAPYPHPAISHEPRIQQLHDDLARAGYQPFHSPCGILLDEGNMPFSRCNRCADCDGFPCLMRAKSDAEVIAIRPALQFPNITLLTNARATQLRTNLAGTAVTDGRRRPRRCDRDLPRRDHRGLLRRRQLGPVAAGLGQRQASARSGQPVRPGRAQLHVPQQHGSARDLEGTEPDPLSEDARPQ
jgi:choline dehydrogenase-like flavoprotein